MRRIILAAIVTLALTISPSMAADKVVVASKIDTEGALLGNMLILMLENGGIATENRTEFGPTPMVRKAIAAGQIDIYPEYTGNGAFFFGLADDPLWKDPSKGYQKVRELDLKTNDIVWLTPAPANNTWAIAGRKDVANANKVYSLEDFARFVNDGGKVKLAGSEEFVNSPAALPAFQEAYGLRFARTSSSPYREAIRPKQKRRPQGALTVLTSPWHMELMGNWRPLALSFLKIPRLFNRSTSRLLS